MPRCPVTVCLGEIFFPLFTVETRSRTGFVNVDVESPVTIEGCNLLGIRIIAIYLPTFRVRSNVVRIAATVREIEFEDGVVRVGTHYPGQSAPCKHGGTDSFECCSSVNDRRGVRHRNLVLQP